MNKAQLTLIFNLSLILWLFCYLISSFVAAHACYYLEVDSDPNRGSNPSGCYEGNGFATVFSIGDDKVFQSVVTGLTAFFHAIYTFWVLKTKKSNSRLLTLLLGMGYMITIMLLISAVFWGTQDLLEKEFIAHGNTSEGGGKQGGDRHFAPNKTLLSTLGAITTFSTLALLSEIGLVYGLNFWSDELIADVGGGYGGYDNFAGNTPAPYEAPTAEPSQYNDL